MNKYTIKAITNVLEVDRSTLNSYRVNANVCINRIKKLKSYMYQLWSLDRESRSKVTDVIKDYANELNRERRKINQYTNAIRYYKNLIKQLTQDLRK